MEQYNLFVNQNLGWIHENKYVLPVISLILGVYAALARPKLPKFMAKLFENPVFRLVVISYIIYRGNKDPQVSLMIALAFLVTMHMINKQYIETLCVPGSTDPACAPDATGSSTTNYTENMCGFPPNPNDPTCAPSCCGSSTCPGPCRS